MLTRRTSLRPTFSPLLSQSGGGSRICLPNGPLRDRPISGGGSRLFPSIFSSVPLVSVWNSPSQGMICVSRQGRAEIVEGSSREFGSQVPDRSRSTSGAGDPLGGLVRWPRELVFPQRAAGNLRMRILCRRMDPGAAPRSAVDSGGSPLCRS